MPLNACLTLLRGGINIMSTEIGVGVSHHRNPLMAGREAVEMALKGGGVGKPDFSFLFATVGYNQKVLLKAVREATGGSPLCGCSAEGTIARGVADESNFSVVVMTIRSDELQFYNGMGSGLKTDSAAAGRSLGRAILPELNSDTLALFLFPDGLTVNFDRFLAGLEDQLDLDSFLPLLGGASCDNLQMKRTYQYCNDEVVSDGAAWALLSGQARIVWAVNHGCISTGVEHKVTRSQGNVIYELDGKPALAILKEYMTDDEILDWSKAFTNLSLGFKVPGDMNEYDQYMIRAMQTRDDETGAVTLPTEVAQGTSIWMTRRDYEKVAAGIDWLAGRIKDQLGGNPAKLVFQFDCAGRGRVFLRDQQKRSLLNRLQQGIPDVPWLGFFTLGEISPVGKVNCFHNYTAVVAAVY
jgi:hypothetical protein